jgi:YVTN family beta-propeller protein
VLEFRILGPFMVVGDGQPVVLGGRKQRALLTVLLLHRGEPLSSDRLIDLLWGERPPATAQTTLRVHVSNLRKTLGSEVVLTRDGGYVLAREAVKLDADRFGELEDQAQTALAAGDARKARELLGEALGLWRGEPLADLAYEPFAQGEIARLQEARLAALEDRIAADLTLGRHRALVGELEVLAEEHPHRERLLGQLMLALYRSGRHADALEAYRSGRGRLHEELGLEPGPELRRLEQRILDHDAGLEAASVAAPSTRMVGRARVTRGRGLIACGGLLLTAAAIVAGIVELAGGQATGVRAEANTVAVIDTRTDRVTGVVAVGARPGAITAAAGSVWVANQDDQTVSRVDPATLATVRTLSLPDPPTGIAAAGDGVWVATSDPSGMLVSATRIDPQFDTLGATVRVGNIVPNTPAAIAGSAGTLWVAPFSGDATELDPRTGRVVRHVDPNAAATGVGVGSGAVWVSDSSADTVTRVDPTGLTTPIAVGHFPSGLAVGDGGVWVADRGDDAVVRIDPDTRAATATIPVGDSPTSVAVGDGSVWVANSGDGTVTRIDPASDKATATITVGGSPQAIAIGDGRAWVSVDAPTIPTGHRQASGGTARLEQSYDVDYMDPAVAYNPLSWQLFYATCAKLLNYPDKPGLAGAELVPEVAQSLPARSADGKTYTFTIRRGFRFSPPSKQPVTAQTFKYTIERTLNPRVHNPVANEFDDILGARTYMAGKAAHIAGVTASGNTLSVRLTAPAPDLASRLAQPFFCAVPSDTPIDPQGVRLIPSAGPYSVASYAPGQGIVLERNPNYHGSRPHWLDRIEVRVNIPGQRAVADVQAGTADYAMDGEIDGTDAATLAARYGPGSPAARAGHQQYFVNLARQLDFLALNTNRPLFADPRMRQAVNYAIDRTALAQLGHEGSLLPDHPADSYLPPNVPGYSNLHIYPLTPDLAKARALAAGHQGRIAVLYTCDAPPCDQQAQIIKTDLAAIGLQLQVKTYPDATLYAKTVNPGGPFDLVWLGWYSDYPDPDAVLNLLLESGKIIPIFNDPTYQARLAAAARLTGPSRYLTYAKLNAQLTRNAAPWVAYGNAYAHDFFSARVGCQTYGVYGIDLAALCLRSRQRPAHPS